MKQVRCNVLQRQTKRPFSAPAIYCVVVLSACIAGCGRGSAPSLGDQLKEMGVAKVSTAKFAGTVTIDGKPPREILKEGLRIVLYDPAKPPAAGALPISAIVNRDDGHFEFTTYLQGDGAPQGSYIVLFVALHHTMVGKKKGFHEPDGLKNLYNDPDKNKDVKEFNVTVAAAGRTDYQFNLEMAGKEPLDRPGPKAITGFP